MTPRASENHIRSRRTKKPWRETEHLVGVEEKSDPAPSFSFFLKFVTPSVSPVAIIRRQPSTTGTAQHQPAAHRCNHRLCIGFVVNPMRSKGSMNGSRGGVATMSIRGHSGASVTKAEASPWVAAQFTIKVWTIGFIRSAAFCIISGQVARREGNEVGRRATLRGTMIYGDRPHDLLPPIYLTF